MKRIRDKARLFLNLHPPCERSAQEHLSEIKPEGLVLFKQWTSTTNASVKDQGSTLLLSQSCWTHCASWVTQTCTWQNDHHSDLQNKGEWTAWRRFTLNHSHFKGFFILLTTSGSFGGCSWCRIDTLFTYFTSSFATICSPLALLF